MNTIKNYTLNKMTKLYAKVSKLQTLKELFSLDYKLYNIFLGISQIIKIWTKIRSRTLVYNFDIIWKNDFNMFNVYIFRSILYTYILSLSFTSSHLPVTSSLHTSKFTQCASKLLCHIHLSICFITKLIPEQITSTQFELNTSVYLNSLK